MVRRALASRSGLTILGALAIIAAWYVWLDLQAVGKVPPDLSTYVSSRGTVDLRVTLRFPPERFHVLTFQQFGRVSGTEGDAVEVRSVPAGRVREIARYYWVKKITPFRE